jgi:hypothetical protein
MSLAEAQNALAAQGGNIALPRNNADTGVQIAFASRPEPAQLKFCDGKLVGYAELIPGGIAGFLERSAAETRQRGLAKPNVSQFQQDGMIVEIIDLEWRSASGSVTLAWTSFGDTAAGTVTVDAPCRAAVAAPAAPLNPTSPSRPRVAPAAVAAAPKPEVPAATFVKPSPPPAIAPAPPEGLATKPAQIPPVASPEKAEEALAKAVPVPAQGGQAKELPAREPADSRTVVAIPLPSDEGPDAVASGLALPAGVAPVTALPPPRPKIVVLPKPPAAPKPPPATPQRVRPDPATAATSTIAPTGRPAQRFNYDPAIEPQETYSTAPPPPLAPARAPSVPAVDTASAEPEEAEAPSAPPTKPAPRPGAWGPKTAADCAKSFRSYDPAKGTYRALDGSTRSCP